MRFLHRIWTGAPALWGRRLILIWLVFIALSAGVTRAQMASIQLLGTLNLPGNFITDVWGYYDAQTQKEYALVGDRYLGLFIVDVTDPFNPQQVALVNSVSGFDVKAWGHYAYTVTGSAFGSGKVVDISDPSNPQVVGSFPSAHNIFISDDGYLVAESPGLKVYDLNGDPTDPTLIWTGSATDGHDAAIIGNRLFDFHGYSATNIYALRGGDPFSATLIGTINDPAIWYHHQGWTTEDGNFLLICDELAYHPTPDITVWDISDPANPVQVGSYADSSATVHNLYVIGQYAFVAYYAAGFRVLDLADPAAPALVDEYDTSPQTSGEGFTGAFGVFPFTHSGNIYVSDEENGLFIFAFQDSTVTGLAQEATSLAVGFSLAQNFPNPFNPQTSIRYTLPRSGMVTLSIYNSRGQRVRTLVNGVQGAGQHQVRWDGRDDQGRPVSAGVYFYQLRAGSFQQVRKMQLVR